MRQRERKAVLPGPVAFFRYGKLYHEGHRIVDFSWLRLLLRAPANASCLKFRPVAHGICAPPFSGVARHFAEDV